MSNSSSKGISPNYTWLQSLRKLSELTCFAQSRNNHSINSLLIRRRGVIRFPAGSGILISVLGLGVCPLSVFCPVLSPAEALTLC